MTVTYSQVPSQSQGIGTIPVTADTYRTEEISGEGDRTKGGAEAIDHDVSSVPEPDHLGAGVPGDDDARRRRRAAPGGPRGRRSRDARR